ncbi:hypothetical protein [Pseudomonas peli]|uniref:hypothetical protein n=1 Tax=Pseudomonas peli TaxID=592361 RepID=UPI0024AE64E5|nr:hypothetical protein [Pseudomonas peli]
MDIKSKLLLSDESPMRVHWFREGGRLRVYQGAVLWANEHGLLVKPECRRSKALPSGLFLFGEYSEADLLAMLREQGFFPDPVVWGWRLSLQSPRCKERERTWVDDQVHRLPVTRWRDTKECEVDLNGNYRQILSELSQWPVEELPPMQASKAIQRWQVRLRKLPPIK